MAGPHQPFGLPDSDLPHQKYMYVCMYVCMYVWPMGYLLFRTLSQTTLSRAFDTAFHMMITGEVWEFEDHC